MHKTETLEIRHQISTDGAGFVVRETFGGQPAIEWYVPTLELAKRLADERQTQWRRHALTWVSRRQSRRAGYSYKGDEKR